MLFDTNFIMYLTIKLLVDVKKKNKKKTKWKKICVLENLLKYSSYFVFS